MAFTWDTTSARWTGSADPGMAAGIEAILDDLDAKSGTGFVGLAHGTFTITLPEGVITLPAAEAALVSGHAALVLTAETVRIEGAVVADHLTVNASTPVILAPGTLTAGAAGSISLGSSLGPGPGIQLVSQFGAGIAGSISPGSSLGLGPNVQLTSQPGGATVTLTTAASTPAQGGLISIGVGPISGTAGDDVIRGTSGNDILMGGEGFDIAIFDAAPGALRIRDGGAGRLTVEGGALGTDTLIGIESIQTPDGSVMLRADLSGLFRTSAAGDSYMLLGRSYLGPVAGLERELFGSAADEVFGGTAQNDFMNLFAGDDAADAGAGHDVIDGGLGSNFLSGGAGRDVFFSDGRGGGVTWTTITDWEAGEQLAVWGWQPGTSRAAWVESDGADGFRGATMHGDLNADGVVDTSVTWSGMALADLPTPLAFDGLLWFIG